MANEQTLTTSLPNGGTIVWSNVVSIQVQRDFNGDLRPYPIGARGGSTGSTTLPPGDYVIVYIGNDCAEAPVLEAIPTPDGCCEDSPQDLIDAINAITATIDNGVDVTATIEGLDANAIAQFEALFTTALEAATVNVEVGNFADIVPHIQAALQWAADNVEFTVLSKQEGTWTVELADGTEVSIDNWSVLTDWLAANELTIDDDDLIAAINGIADSDDTDDDYRPGIVACYEGDNGSFSGWPVVGENGALDSWHVISGAAPTDPNSVSVCTAPTAVVYSCGWIPGGSLFWHYYDDVNGDGSYGNPDGKAVDTFDLFGVGEGNLQVWNTPWSATGSGFIHANGAPNDQACEPYNFRAVFDSPGYTSPANSNNDSNQAKAFGIYFAPPGETEARLGVRSNNGQSIVGLMAGPTAANMSLLVDGYVTGLNAANTSPIQTIALTADFTKYDGLGTAVFFEIASANNRASGGLGIVEQLSDGTIQDVPLSRLSCAQPTLSQSAREVELPYTLVNGESFGPCEVPLTSTVVTGGIAYTSCQASDDGRTILLNTTNGELFETDLTPVPDGITCGTSSTVVSTIQGCASDGAGGQTPAYWEVFSDGTVNGPILANTLPGYIEGCC